MVERHSSTTHHANKKSPWREYITPAGSQINNLNRKKGLMLTITLLKSMEIQLWALTSCISPRGRGFAHAGSWWSWTWFPTLSCGTGCAPYGSCGLHGTRAPAGSPGSSPSAAMFLGRGWGGWWWLATVAVRRPRTWRPERKMRRRRRGRPKFWK